MFIGQQLYGMAHFDCFVCKDGKQSKDLTLVTAWKWFSRFWKGNMLSCPPLPQQVPSSGGAQPRHSQPASQACWIPKLTVIVYHLLNYYNNPTSQVLVGSVLHTGKLGLRVLLELVGNRDENTGLLNPSHVHVLYYSSLYCPWPHRETLSSPLFREREPMVYGPWQKPIQLIK